MWSAIGKMIFGLFLVVILINFHKAKAQNCSMYSPCLLKGGDDYTAPKILRSTNGTLELTLVVDVSAFTFEWFTTYRRSYNATIPGPTWLIKPGDKVVVTLINNLEPSVNTKPNHTLRFPNITNLHTHGLHISSKEPQDNTFIKIDAGSSYTYRYEIESDHPAGTYWYHAHVHGSTSLQIMSGMAGMIIVEDPVTGLHAAPQHLADVSCPNNCKHEVHLLIQPTLLYAKMSKFRRSFTYIQYFTRDNELFRNMELTQYNVTLEHWLRNVSNGFTYQTTNGKLFPKINITAGQRKRFRLVNGGGTQTIEALLTDQGGRTATNACEFWEIAFDGMYLNSARKARLGKSLLMPASRVDWIVVCNQPGIYELRSVPDPLDSCSLGFTERYDNLLLTIIVTGVSVPPSEQETTLPTRPSYVDNFLDIPSDQIFPQRFTVQAGFIARLNRRRFLSSEDFRFAMPVNSIQEWHFTNSDAEEGHSMHIHINHFQVVSYNAYNGPISTFTSPGNVSLVYLNQDGELCPTQDPTYNGGPAFFPGITYSNGSTPCSPWVHPNYTEQSMKGGPGSLGYVQPGEFRDVINLPPQANITIRFKADKFTGAQTVHCHNVFHADAGMIMVTKIVPPDGDTSINDSPSLKEIGRCGSASLWLQLRHIALRFSTFLSTVLAFFEKITNNAA